ncbi:MAG TPA: hypothetical protein VF219_04145 [Vicinamibacterales bacterium]
MRAGALPTPHFAGLGANGSPTFGERTRFGFAVVMEVGRLSFGNLRESENAPLAERCFPILGVRISTS